MSAVGDCGVCLSPYDGQTDFSRVRICTARKPHACCECGKTIEKGQQYEYARGKSEGDFWTAQTCLICAEIANAFYCHGRTFGGILWDDMDEVWAELNSACLDKLQTAAAKAELVKRWNQWKFQG